MNVVDFLAAHRVDFKTVGQHHHARSGWAQLDCPWCEESGRYHLGINLDRLYANCWKCGRKDLRAVLAAVTDVPYAEIKRELPTWTRARTTELPEKRGTLRLPDGIGPLLRPHREYLRARGFVPQQIAQLWEVGGIGLAARLAWRLFIPVHQQGRIVSWTTRSLSATGKRYIHAKPDEEERSTKSLLYGSDYARHAVIVHEGPTDVWRTGPGAVCVMGLGFSTTHVRLLSRYSLRAICFDTSHAAQRRATELRNALAAYPGRTLVVELDADDPGSADDREIRRLRRAVFGKASSAP